MCIFYKLSAFAIFNKMWSTYNLIFQHFCLFELTISYNQFCCWTVLKTSYKVRMNFFVSDSACKEACWRIKLFRNGLDLFSLSKFLCPVKGECTFSITKLYKQICIISLLLQPFFLIKQRLYTIHSLILSDSVCDEPNVVDIHHFQNILIWRR